jgi:hypothetical protein
MHDIKINLYIVMLKINHLTLKYATTLSIFFNLAIYIA